MNPFQDLIPNKNTANPFADLVGKPAQRKTPLSEKVASGLDLVFGGGKVGEAIGTKIAEMRAKPNEKQYITPSPSKGQIVGSALQSALLFAPIGGASAGIASAVGKTGLKTGASAIGKIGTGALVGGAYDVSTNLQEGKTGISALKPGLGTAIGAGIPAVGVGVNLTKRSLSKQAPRVINSLIKPLAKDFSYGKNPGRAVAEEKIVANNFDDLLTKISSSRQKTGQAIGELGSKLSTKPIINIESSLSPIREAMNVAASQNNPSLLKRLVDVKTAVTSILEPAIDKEGNIIIKEVGKRKLSGLNFQETRDVLGKIGELTSFTGNPTDDKLVNSALKRTYGAIKESSIKAAQDIDPQAAKQFTKLTEKYADLSSAEIATRYRDKIVERSALIGLSPQIAGIGTGLITAVATGGTTLPAVIAGISGAVIDKLAQTPAFKTRFAALLSSLGQAEISSLIQKAPALAKFLPKGSAVSPGDRLLQTKIGSDLKGFAKNPKLGMSIEDISKKGSPVVGKTAVGYKGEKDLTTKILKNLEGKTTVSKQYILDATNRGELKQVERDLIRQVLDDMNPKKADGYTMSHRPTEGVRAFNLTEKVNGEEMIPKDMYEKWYGSRGTKADNESIAVLKAIKDKPEASVTIYRASPKPDFNDGDWVSLSKTYATEHAQGNGTKVHSKVVKAKDLKWAMDDVNEFGYYPEKSDTINVSDFAKKVKAELLPLKELEEAIIKEAKVSSRSLEEFIGKVRGSATQYGDYNPALRKYGIGEKSKRVSDLGIDPDMEITVYRGIDDLSGKIKRQISDGDFIIADFDQALSYTGSPKDVVAKKVKIKDLIAQFPDEFAKDIKEYGLEETLASTELIYSNSKNPLINLSKQDLTKIWESVNNK